MSWPPVTAEVSEASPSVTDGWTVAPASLELPAGLDAADFLASSLSPAAACGGGSENGIMSKSTGVLVDGGALTSRCPGPGGGAFTSTRE